ncbi:LOW QUALITY PROTEIN: sorting nexin-13-like [Paramacrobiotus metropolitanus]|uniref:LOW QUALITY PROTEIN: sorting nexin-13-like n=1 Tax=Paramacrobiotus metropolitanus TaxID=2943436 RepID=UPI002446081A|nr:LOW QUALITY PROTEIN: sorting nexin-13-like [Paramacrobiotus metropolitanus]
METAKLLGGSLVVVVVLLILEISGFSLFGFFWLVLCTIPPFLLGATYIASLYSKAYLKRNPFQLRAFRYEQFFSDRFWQKCSSSRQKPPKLDRRLTGSSAVDEQLQELLNFIFRDYLLAWYKMFFKNDEEFPFLLRSELHNFIVDFSALCKDINWLQFCTEELIQIFATHVRLFRIASRTKDPEYTIEQIFFQLEEKEFGYSREAVCIDLVTEKDYFLQLSHQLVYMHGSHRSFECLPYRELAKEVLATQVFQSLLKTFCDPDYINQTIIWLFCTAENIGINNECFVQVLRASPNLSELKVLEGMLITEIAIQRANDTGGSASEETKAKLNSLLYIKQLLDHRVRLVASGADDNRSQYSLDAATTYNDFARMVPVKRPSLEEVLDNSIALSFFMNYMETKNGTPLIHFYLTCAGFQASAEQLLEEYKSTGTQNKLELLRNQGLNIISHYFSNQTQYQISMEDEILLKRARKMLIQEVPSAYAFKEMQDKIYKIIRENYFPAFEQSDRYMKMLLELNLLRPMEESDNSSETKDHQGKPRLSASITSTMESRDPQTRKSFTNYLIEVTAQYPDGKGKVWTTCRRYMEFHDLHVQIERLFPNLSGLNFPGKKLNNMTNEVLSRRKTELHLYLQTLLFEDVLKNNEGLAEIMETFLRQEKYEMTRNGVERRLDTMVLPVITSVRSMTNAVLAMPQNVARLSDTIRDGFLKVLNLDSIDSGAQNGAFFDSEINENIPLRIMMTLMDEIFDLKSTTQFWLRSQVITILKGTMKAVYGDKINRMIVDYVDELTSTKEIAKALSAMKNALWPGGIPREPAQPRDERNKYAARVCAKSVLLTMMTEHLSATLGSQTTKRGALRFFDLLQNTALNRRLFYVILESILSTLYEKYPMKKWFVSFHSSQKLPKRSSAST